MFILIFLSTFLILSRGKTRRSIDGYNADDVNWEPLFSIPEGADHSSNYDITFWVRQLHLQECAFVEIGDGFCALFVEQPNLPSPRILDNSGVTEFFFGICLCAALHLWDLCSAELTKLRKLDCTFNEGTPYSNTSARVHRRLCDVTLISKNAPTCNCSIPMAGQQLEKTGGFPTCFLNPLPESLCSPRGVCGVAQCAASTVKGLHTVRCASNCHQRQPFCEEIGHPTSASRAVYSAWSRWSSAKCNNTCGRGLMVDFAECYDQLTERPAVDCFGPGFSCCTEDFGKCYCEVTTTDGIMRAFRFSEPCVSTEGCTSDDARPLAFEGEPGLGNTIDFDETYDDDRKRFEDAPQCSDSSSPTRRRLLYVPYNNEEYKFHEDDLRDREFRSNRKHRSILKDRLGGGSDYNGENEETGDDEDDDNILYEESSDEAEEEEEEDGEDENGEETIGPGGSAKGRWSPRKRTRVARSDYAAAAFEGKVKVDEPEKGPAKIRSVTDECNDSITELLRYYDYETSEGTPSRANDNVDNAFFVKFVVQVIVVGALGS